MACFRLLCMSQPALNQQSHLEVYQLPESPQGHISHAVMEAGGQVAEPECTSTALCVLLLASNCSRM